MSLFSAAIDTLYGSNDFAVDGTYTPAGGSPASVRVILRRPDEAAALLGVGAIVGKYEAAIRTSQLAAAAEGDTLTIGSKTYTVENPYIWDTDRLEWTMGLRN